MKKGISEKIIEEDASIVEIVEGIRLHEEIKEMDHITMNLSKIEEMNTFVSKIESVNFTPFLKKGALEMNRDGFSCLCIFNVLENDSFTKIEFSIVEHYGKTWCWVETSEMRYRTETKILKVKEDMEILKWENPYSLAYKKNERYRKREKYIKDHVNENLVLRFIFLTLCAYVNELMKNPELKIVEKNPKLMKKSQLSSGNNPIQPQEKKNTIILNGIRIEAAGEVTKRLVSNKRWTESWSVRGHYRHCSSGKVVYIKPHVRGEGRIKGKEYKIE